MTREEEIQEAIKTLQVYDCGDNGLFECSECIDSDIQNAFYQGAKWADNNPKFPWISVKEDLPCNHEEMVYINPLDRFDQRTSWCIVSDGRFISMDRMYNFTDFTNDWKWGTKLHNVKYWSPLPKLPKE